MSQWIYISQPEQSPILLSELWTPAQIDSSNLKIWLDAYDASTITKDNNNYVCQWNDKSGNGNHAMQSNGSYQPYFEEPAKGLYFNGDYLRIPDYYPTAAIFAVVNATDTSGYRHILRKGYQAAQSLEYGLRITSGSLTGWYTNTSGTNGLKDKAWFPSSQKVLCASSWDGATVNVNYNASTSPETLSFSGSLFNSSWGTRIGAGWGSESESGAPVQGFVGYIHELLFLSSVPGEGKRQKIEGFFAHKWGFTASLPTGHPYKSSAPTV